MSKLTTSQARKTFIEFFQNEHGHLFVPSMPVIPYSDPTLLFTNSGMVQFKEIFQGKVVPGSELHKFKLAKRVANSQGCIRAGGKHNDLDDVGKDTYHHTFFEMLGNWSFGDYFKEEAINQAWTLLTEKYGLPKERLYATYFGGEPGMDVPADLEAKKLWERYLDPSRVLPFGKKENFWEMGDKGPCGPCSEIHFDRIGGRDAASLVNMDDPNVLEIWNLVFMQYNREEDSSLTLLPAPCVDTGMGLERIASVIADAKSNYDIDIWDPIFAAIQKETGYPTPYAHGCGTQDDDIAYRVVADHIRTTTFAIADGCGPGVEGRSYVVRRIIRRAIKYGREQLGAKTVGWFSNLVDAVVEAMSDYFTPLQDAKTVAHVKRTLLAEEELFSRTWDAGVREYRKATQSCANGVISGKTAFVLHSAYGFPLDLQQIMAEQDKLKIDEKEYHLEWEAHVNKSKGKMQSATVLLNPEQIKQLETDGVTPTKDDPKYKTENIEVQCKAIFDIQNKKFVDSLTGALVEVGIVLDATNFYAEAGGQVGDRGILKSGDTVIQVEDTQNYAGYVIHKGTLTGVITTGDKLEAIVDFELRRDVTVNHTTTHVLNHALREALVRRSGAEEKVEQQGSQVDEKTLRFDFSYGKKLTIQQIKEVQELVQKAITDKLEVSTLELPKEVALEISSIRSVFGEKYPDVVRVVCVGANLNEVLKDPKSEKWFQYSIEFCGGTHLASMEAVEDAVIIREDSLGGNTRRIVMYTRGAAQEATKRAADLEKQLEEVKLVPDIEQRLQQISKFGNDLEKAVIPLLRKHDLQDLKEKAWNEANKQKKELDNLSKVWAKEVATKLANECAEKKFVVELIRTRNNPKQLLTEITTTKSPLFLVVAGESGENGTVLATSPAGVVNAKDWIAASGGKGGGSAERSQGGTANASEATRLALEYIQKMVN